MAESGRRSFVRPELRDKSVGPKRRVGSSRRNQREPWRGLTRFIPKPYGMT